jgi:hypothetical protein
MKKRGQITIFIILAVILVIIITTYFVLLRPAKTTDEQNNPSQPHICTNEEKQNKICTMEYIGVCGNNNITYATGCTACSAGVYSWAIGEC